MEQRSVRSVVFFVLLSILLFGRGMCLANSPYRYVRILEGVDKEHVMVSKAAKDPAGMIWLVAGGELFRFDGVQVSPFAKLYAGRLPFDEIQDLAIDPWGRLWINSRNGILVFDTQSWEFCFDPPFVKNLTHQKAIGFCYSKGAFFVATEAGQVWQIQKSKKQFLFSFDYAKGLGRTPVGRMFVADEEAVWLAMNERLYRYNLKAETRRVCAIPLPLFEYLEDLLPLKGGLLLRSYKQGYYVYNGETFALTSFRSVEDHDFTNWNHWGIADSDKLKFFHKKGQYFEYTRDVRFKLIKKGSHRLAESVLYKKLNNWQRSGDEWLLSTDQGLYAAFPAEISFDFMECGSARGMVKQNQHYYIGGYGYLDVLPVGGAVRAFVEAPEKNYYSFLPLNADTALIAMEGDFLANLRNGRYSPAKINVAPEFRSRFSTMAYCAIKYEKDTVLVGTANGIWKYALRTGSVAPLGSTKGHIVGEGMLISSLRYRDGILTFTAEDGYFEWKNALVKKVYPQGDAKLMIYDHVLCEGKVYLATKGRGLVLLDNGKSEVCGVQQGLASNIVYQLFNFQGSIFAGTHRGLSVKTGDKIYNYHIADGLPFEEFNHKALYYDKEEGQLFMGGTGGYVGFSPQELLALAEIEFAPKPRVSSLHIGMKANLFEHNYATEALLDTINLPREAVMFTMDFARPDYYRQGYNMSYKIEPLMDGYQEMPSSNQINLSGMTAGEYRIFVKVQPSNTSRTETWSWLVQKQPVFMETQAFYFLVLLGISAVTTYVMFERARRKKNEKLLRRQISSDLHDEVGGLLTGISMQADLLMLGGEKGQEDSLQSIGRFSREATQMMDDIIWSIDGRNNYQGSLEDRIKFLAGNMLEPLGAHVVFDVNIEYDKSIRQVVRQHVYLLFKEMVHNICKHAHPDRIDIVLHFQNGDLCLKVTNDGVVEPTPQQKLRTGQGIGNMELRVQQIGGVMKRWREEGMYIVELTVPSRRAPLRRWV